MNARIVLGILLAIATALGVATGFAYSSGRWHVVPGPELLCSELGGVIAGTVVTSRILLLFKQKSLFYKSVCYGIVVGLISLIYRSLSSLMLHAYILGFEQAIFNTATVEQWGSVGSVAEKWLAQPIHNGEWSSEQCPKFVSKVYPYQIPYSGFLPTTDSKNEDVFILWRGISFSGGLVIGKGNLIEGEPLGMIYKRQYSDNVTIAIFGGD